MLPVKYVKRVAWVCAGLLALSLALLGGLEYASFAGGVASDSTAAFESVYYDGAADFAVLLCAERGPDRTALLSLLRQSYGAPVLLASMPPDAVSRVPAFVSLLSRESGVAPERILVVGVGDRADFALTQAGHTQSVVLGAALVRPSAGALADLSSQRAYPPPPSTLFLAGHADSSDDLARRTVEYYNLLSGDSISYNGRPLRAERGDVSLMLAPSDTLSDASPSDELLGGLSRWISSLTGGPVVSSRLSSLKTLLWLTASAALLVGLFLLATLCRTSYEGPTGVVTAEIKSRWLFFLGRAVLWLAALPATGLTYLALALFNAPLGVGGRLLVGYVVGCSLSTGLLYRLGMLGVRGQPSDIKPTLTARGLLLSGGLLAATLLTGCLLAVTGFWGIETARSRLVFFAVLWAALSVGMLSVMHDALVLIDAARTEEGAVALLLIPYLPILAVAVLCVPMGLLPSGVALLRMAAVFVVSVLSAKVIRELNGSALLAGVGGALPFALFAALQTYL